MGCGRVGSELSHAVAGGRPRRHRDRQEPRGLLALPAGRRRDANSSGSGSTARPSRKPASRRPTRFVAVSSGDNSNIVSARVALEHYHVPKVVARIYDPRRAEIYGRLNIPTVATTTWGIRQIQLMLLHDREEVRETLGGGDTPARARAGAGRTWSGKPGEHAQRRRARSWSPASRAEARASCRHRRARCRRATTSS